ncbi:hypothetical protein SAMN06265379_1135 [Saccharicrinis carchari]|uniref:Uncharacterized protein n=1 Tax=Saccharicrinis carchari TaxID=1168039 RepID=A0A521F1K6_SACCC|nr:hypothetical protein SAMN06265379_1135 [Saccharicrinis carchari]
MPTQKKAGKLLRPMLVIVVYFYNKSLANSAK